MSKLRVFIIFALTLMIVGLLFYALFLLPPTSKKDNLNLTQSLDEPPPITNDTVDVVDDGNRRKVSIISVGDIMLGRNVEGRMDEKGLGYPFEKIKSYFSAADLTVGNLEGPILKKHTRTPTGSTTFNFDFAVTAELSKAGFKLISLANNHTFDYGAAGFAETKNYLQEAGLWSFGHPREIKDDYVWRGEINNRKFAFIGLQDVFASMDASKAVTLVKTIASDLDTITIVYIHWGDEYKLTNNKRQQTLAHDFIDSGADVIIGHHPHVVQNIEIYKNKLIFYSLGNFIFDQYFSKETQEGLMLEMFFVDSSMDVNLYPVNIASSQPAPMSESMASEWLGSLAGRGSRELSDEIKTGKISVPLETLTIKNL